MQRYDILFGIVLIFSIIDFALAAPVPVQEKPQPYVDVVQIPKDLRTVLRRVVGEDELEEFFKTLENPIESSDTHASSSSAPPVPDHGPMAQAPAPNPASSTANPDSSIEPPSLLGAVSMPGDQFKEALDNEYSSQGGHNSLDTMPIPGSSEVGSDDNKWTSPKSNPMPSADADTGDFNWDYWKNLESPPRQSAAPPEEVGLPVAPATDNFDWEYWRNLRSSPRQSAAPPEEIGLAVAPATDNFDWEYWKNLESPPRQSAAPQEEHSLP
jgi:hypothetical protein